MENSLKGLMLAAGTIITCVVITLGFYISKEARTTAANGANEINKLNAEFAESDKMIYDGAVVSGSEVVNFIKKMQDETVGVCVKTNSYQMFFGYSFDIDKGELGTVSNNTYEDAIRQTGTTYVNPYGSFRGSIVRDANKVIIGIVFTQE